ncbi:hypothetical protein OC846_000291 [Tilletia horrida]|uniref:BAG domain-containing protein n=1 Tax=Tilletia horrida TaxID=155126 RepID=A0AAN6JX61_9BASI|nr:hypothetical protein OC846_000291 [Tilletia horrida]KAK0570301.1 hypothetical protein OC861_000044 [Tilletia horrida]
MSWFSSQFNRWSEAAREGAAAVEIRHLQVIWGKEHLHIDLPKAVQPPTLRNLKDQLANVTAVPVQQQKLIHQGLLLKDDRTPLGAYGIREGSKITLIGTAGGVNVSTGPGAGTDGAPPPPGRLAAEEAERARRARDEDQSEDGLLRRIDQTLKGVTEDLLPEILQLEGEIARSRGAAASSDSKATPTPTTSAAPPPPQPGSAPSSSAQAPTDSPQKQASSLDSKQLSALHRKLSELLLRALLALDTVPVNSDNIRTARKAAVRQIQAYLDRVDQAWELYKSAGTASSVAQL